MKSIMKYIVISAVHLFLIFSNISASVLPREFNDNEYIRCDYVHRIGIARYECLLSINNPNCIEFDEIEGTHLPGMSDADVEIVYAYSGNSKIVPSVICRQFPNVHQLTLMGLNIEEITPNDFDACNNLVEIYLNSNKIVKVPANTFANSPDLTHIELSSNKLSELVENSFTGTALETIALDRNEITSIDPNWFSSVNGTLKHLSIISNLVSEIGSDDFRHLQNLEILSLGSNPITQIAPEAFNSLNKLKSLDLNGCSLTSLLADWFQNLSSLTVLNLQNNKIEELPDGVFGSLTSLRSFYFRGNNLLRLNADAFGDSLMTIAALFGERNKIRAIDPKILQEASNLELLYLGGNACVQENFANVQTNLDKILGRLSICIKLWDAVPELECNYDVTIYDEYRCNLQVFNPLGDEFDVIVGDHMPEKSNDDVQLVSILQQNTKTFPAVICSQFSDIHEIFVMGSQIEVIEAADFENCRNMEQVYLNQNRITSIPANLFANSPKLFYISLSTNYISQIHPDAFVGTVTEHLDLGNNQLTAINPEWFTPISEKLDMVDFFGNLLTTLPDGTFSALKHVEFLMLGNNRLQMGSNPFVGLDNLKIIALGRNNLQRLNPSWFEAIPHLQELFLCMNGIAELQDGIFSIFTNLKLLRLNGNRLTTVSAEMIGPSISTLKNIQVINNQMVSFDPQILDGAVNLKYLMLEGNICINEAFDDVQSELDEVTDKLRTCFRNFDTAPEIICEYEVTADDEYICNAKVHNPFNENFQVIPGEHLTYRSNDEVSMVRIQSQNTRTFPEVICKQFGNVKKIIIIDSNLDTLSPSTFEDCINLEIISINQNKITSLPANLFINSPKLYQISFASNRISQIHADAFVGTELEVLDLSSNRIAEINKNWFSQTLLELNFLDNTINHVPDSTFSELSSLKVLTLSINQIHMDDNPFEGLTSLERLGLGRNGISELNPSWFTPIPQLQELFLCGNRLTELQDGVFSSFQNLSLLRINENLLTAVKAESLGDAAATLRNFQLKNNQITSFDPQILDNAVNLQLLMLEGNICIDQNFDDVQTRVNEIKELLNVCTRKKRTAFSGIECIYDVTSTGYRCNALINNPTGIDFASISGQHLPGRTDADVQIVSILSQNTRNFPGIFCRQFGNVQEISIVQSNLEVVESLAFADCRSMERVIINENFVTSLPANLFSNSPRLHHVSFLFNNINQIHANAFSGTSIEFLDFGNNVLTAINSQWFIPISSTLRSLDFFNNMIAQVPDGVFSTLSRVEFLMIGMNGVQLGNNPFLGLTSLRTLGLGRNGFQEINPSWFPPISQLQELFLCGNAITQIRPGDLDALNNLITLRLIGNRLSTLRLESLGPSIATLRNIQFINNVITSFDPQIIERTPNLQILMLTGNLCINQDFLDVQNEKDLVRQALQQCYANF